MPLQMALDLDGRTFFAFLASFKTLLGLR